MCIRDSHGPASDVHDLIRQTGDEQAHLIAGEGVDGRRSGFQRLAAQVRFRAVARRQRRGQHILQLPHVPLGLAAFTVMGLSLIHI